MEYIVEGFLKAFQLLIEGDDETYSAISVTLQVSTYSMMASLSLGVPIGFLLGYSDFNGKKFIRAVVDTLLAMPTVLIGLLVYAFLSRQGPFGSFGILFTPFAIAIGQTILALPIVIALTATAIENLDCRLRVTLLTLGANQLQLFLTSLWEARYAVAAAGVAAYGRVLTEVGISMMVGGNIKWHSRTITTAIALETHKGKFAMGIALGFVLMLIAFVVNMLLLFLKKKC